MRIKTIFILCFALLLFSGCANNKKRKGETSPVLSEIQKKYIDEGWLLKSNSSMDGELPSSYGVKPKYGLQDNYFDINMGEGCDIAVKIIDLSNDRCIRYIFVSENSSITINQIPQGQYYLKIAYGYDWMEKFEDGMTHGKFTRNCYYEKSVDVFDFGKKNSQHTINYILNINIQNIINSMLRIFLAKIEDIYAFFIITVTCKLTMSHTIFEFFHPIITIGYLKIILTLWYLIYCY